MRITTMWRYPVKSMLGERLEEAHLEPAGLESDRGLALIDAATGLVATAKHPRLWRDLLTYSATVAGTGVRISSPAGWTLDATDPEIDERLSAALGRPVRLSAERPDAATVERPDPEDVLDQGVEAEVSAATLEIGQGTPGVTFVDYAPVHLITTATLDEIGTEHIRYRPNLVVETPPGTPAFVENDWMGRELHVGGRTVLRADAADPALLRAHSGARRPPPRRARRADADDRQPRGRARLRRAAVRGRLRRGRARPASSASATRSPYAEGSGGGPSSHARIASVCSPTAGIGPSRGGFERRAEAAHRARRRADLRPAVPGDELRMVEHVGDLAAAGVRDPRRVQPSDDLGGRQRRRTRRRSRRAAQAGSRAWPRRWRTVRRRPPRGGAAPGRRTPPTPARSGCRARPRRRRRRRTRRTGRSRRG